MRRLPEPRPRGVVGAKEAVRPCGRGADGGRDDAQQGDPRAGLWRRGRVHVPAPHATLRQRYDYIQRLRTSHYIILFLRLIT